MPTKTKERPKGLVKSSSDDRSSHLDGAVVLLGEEGSVNGGWEERDTEYVLYREELLDS